MKVLLTGATGFVGRHAADELARAGHDLRCLVRSEPRAEHLAAAGHELVVGDLSSTLLLRDALQGCDAVVHVAGLITARSFEAMRAVNEGGAARLAAACAAAGTVRRFLLVSSLAAGGPSVDRGVSEEDDDRPVSRYGLTKLLGEHAARRALPGQVELTVIRPPAVYGPWDRGILDLFRAAARGVRLRIGTRPRRVSIVHGADLAVGLRQALEAPSAAGRTYYLANPGSLPIDAVLEKIADAVGRRGVTVRVPECVIQAVGVVAEEIARIRGRVPEFSRDKAVEFTASGWACDVSRARRDLGWEPARTLDDGLRETAAWYRARAWIP